MPPMRGGRMHSKPKNFKGTAKRMIKDFKGDLPLISVVIILAIASAFMSVYTPYIFNDLISTSTIQTMFLIILIISSIISTDFNKPSKI